MLNFTGCPLPSTRTPNSNFSPFAPADAAIGAPVFHPRGEAAISTASGRNLRSLRLLSLELELSPPAPQQLAPCDSYLTPMYLLLHFGQKTVRVSKFSADFQFQVVRPVCLSRC